MAEYKKAQHSLTLVHVQLDKQGGNETGDVDLSEGETKRLRSWVERMMRLEDAPVARRLYSFLNTIIYQQAIEQGYSDAIEFGYYKVHSIAAGVWRDGYTQGFATGMSDRYEEKIN